MYFNSSWIQAARKNTQIKLESMSELFRMDDYPAVWSNTITNHDYIFNNPKQIDDGDSN